MSTLCVNRYVEPWEPEKNDVDSPLCLVDYTLRLVP